MNIRTITAYAIVLCAYATSTAAMPIVTEVPETAIEQEYTFCGGMFSTFWGKVITGEEDMLPATMAIDGSTIYWYDPMLEGYNSYIVGQKDQNNVVTFNFPQQLSATSYANRMTKTSAEGQDLAYATVDTQENYITFTIDDNGVMTMDDSDFYDLTIIGVTSAAGDWQSKGIYAVTMTPFNQKVVTPPSSLTTDTWIMSSEKGTREVKVIQDSSNADDTYVYIRGVWASNPTLWIKGHIADGKLTFSSDTYVGVDVTTGWRCFLYGSTPEDAYSESAGAYIDNKPLDAFVMKYDAATDSYSAECNLSICPGTKYINMPGFAPIKDMTLRPKAEITDFTPAEPNIDVIQQYLNFPANDGWDYVDIYLADTNVDGQPLNTANLYYRMFLDGKPYILDPDEYDGITTATEWIPFNFTSYDLENIGGTGRSVTYYQRGTVYGVQEKYVDGDKEYLSAIVQKDIYGAGVNTIDAEEAVDVIYTDLTGRTVVAPAAGMYIKTTVLRNGTLVNTKVIVK